MDYSQNNFKSWSAHMNGAVTYVSDIPIGSKIVSIDFLQSGTASNTWFECDGMQLSRNFARDAEVELAFVSTTTCKAVKTGNDESFVTVVYSSGPTSVPPVLTPDVLFLLVPAFFFFFLAIVKFWIEYLKK